LSPAFVTFHARKLRYYQSVSLVVTAFAFLVAVSVSASAQGASDELKKKIDAAVAVSGAETVAVALYDFETAKEFLINPDVSFHAASTMKVPVMMEVFRQAEEGRFSLDDQIPVRNEFKSIADGSSFSVSPDDDSETTLYKKVGQTESVRELVRLMIDVSSNLATNILIDRVTPVRVMELMSKTGAKNIRVLRGVEDGKAFERGMNNATTARDLMIILREIADGQAVSKPASDAMVRVLLGQKLNEGIPSGVPSTVRVAHKTGSITKNNHDAGIVYSPGAKRKPYVLVVLTRGIADEKRSSRLIADISRIVYEDLK
jgi:beta-lactamase class A